MPRQSGYEHSAHLYDLFDQKPNIAFFRRIGLRFGAVLDIGAGTGRIAIPLAKAGVEVCCIEPSPAMRRVLTEKLAEHTALSERIRLLPADASNFDADRTYPAAILSGTFDHLLDDSERRVALSNIARHLDPGGSLTFDVFLGLMTARPLAPAGTVKVGDCEHRRFVGGRLLSPNVKESILVFETYAGNKLVERTEERSLVGVTDRAAIHSVLGETGFKLNREWRDYDRNPYQTGDPLLILDAVKDPTGSTPSAE
jgi:SAM-dependent methyltransferase